MHPKPIVRLSPDVVNRVAAGEVIHRPASALKEMLENSLDAGSRSITVTVRDGGNKLLQVTDDGCGIRDVDLPILCERHTTSKIRTFEDLEGVSTFGFRGEALASMSFVANLTVTTMTADAAHATRCAYADGKMTDEGACPTAGVPGTTIVVENLFYNVLTRKRALRSSSEELAKVLEVTQRVAASRPDVAFCVRKLGDARPALRCPVVESRTDRLRAIYGPRTAKHLMTFRCSSEGDGEGTLDDVEIEEKENITKKMKFSVDASVSTAGYHSRKTTLILFINGRLVECQSLKRAIETTYARVLPKPEKPFAFVSLALPRRSVDVNVHPTKREVRFLHQDEIVESIAQRLGDVLDAANGSRMFNEGTVVDGDLETDDVDGTTPPERDERRSQKNKNKNAQTLLPGARVPGEVSGEAEERDVALVAVDGAGIDRRVAKRPKTTTRDLVARDDKLVRVDPGQAAGSLDAFFRRARFGAPPGFGGNASAGDDAAEPRSAAEPRNAAEPRSAREGTRADEDALDGKEPASPNDDYLSVPDGETTPLSSVRELWGEILRNQHEGFTRVFRNMVVVGALPTPRRGTDAPPLPSETHEDFSDVWLIQHSTALLLLRFQTVAREFFYQRVLARFGTLPTRKLDPPASVTDLVRCALETERERYRIRDLLEGNETNDDDDDEEEERAWLTESRRAAIAARDVLAEKAELLRDYFGVDVDAATGCVAGVPVLLDGHAPDLRGLPEFVLGLANDVEWGEEKACFRSTAEVIAKFYACDGDAWTVSGGGGGGDGGDGGGGEPAEDDSERVRQIKQFVFPAMRRYLRPSRDLAAQRVATQVASLEQLYRVFERC